MVAGTSLSYVGKPNPPAKQGNCFQLSGPWQNNLEDLSESSPGNSEQCAFKEPIRPHRIYLDTTKIRYCVPPHQTSPSYTRKDRTVPPPNREVRKHL